MDKIQAQAAKLWDLIFAAETTSTYKKTLALTGEILLESGRLVWLLLCLVLILGAWVGSYAVATGQNLRVWYQQLSQQDDSESAQEMFASAGKTLLSVSNNGANFLLSQAKDQLGIELPAPSVKAITPEKPAPTVATPQPSSPPEPPSPVVETSTAQTPSAQPAPTQTPGAAVEADDA